MDILTKERWLRVLLALLAAAALAACGGDADQGQPPPTEIAVSFRPASSNLRLIVGDELDLWVEVSGAEEHSVVWRRFGLVVATTDTYRLVTDRVGVDTVWAEVVAADRDLNRSWRVDVAPDLSKLPREVSGLSLADGPGPAEVDVGWSRSVPTEYPLDSYEIAVSYVGQITDDNWDDATVVAVVPHAGLPLRPVTRISSATHGLLAGQRTWFAVRAVDDHGQVSAVKESFYRDVTYPWYLEVRVQDDAARPLTSIILVYGPDDARAVTDVAGDCTLGPFRSIDLIPVATRAPNGDGGEPLPWYYNYVAEPRGVGEGALFITLPERHVLDLYDCELFVPYDNFMTYLQHMTVTAAPTDTRPNRYLYRWSEHPVRVHFEQRLEAGHQIADSVRVAMEMWNEKIGIEIMTEVADQLAADIRCVWDPNLGSVLSGEVRSLTAGNDLSREIPQVFEVAIDPTDLYPSGVFRPLTVTEIALHEFGHALGLYQHSCSSGKGNLMDNGGAHGILENEPEQAIRGTEWRAVRAILNLPQGVDMTGYERY